MLKDSEILMAGTSATEDDKRLFVKFSLQDRLDKVQTAIEGRHVYKDVEFITILVPGDRTTTVHRPVQASDKQRFPLQYAAFKNAQGDIVVGTPLRLWPGCKPSQVRELEFFGVTTVEQLAAMPDNVGGAQMMGIQALKRAAQQYVQQAKDNAPLLQVQKELESRDAEVAVLRDSLAEQKAILDKLIANLAAGEKPAKAK